MYLRELELRDFRSWPHLRVTLRPGVTVFAGQNGYGKTNIIEAIGYLAHLGSHRVTIDAPLVRDGADSARVSATTVNGGRELTSHVLIKPHAANSAQINRTRLKSPRELLGVTQSVLFSPEDLSLIKGEPAERRRYLDDLVASRTPRLAGVKAEYDKILRQRGALLKSAGQAMRRGYTDGEGAAALSTLDVWDAQLAHLGAQVIASRVGIIDVAFPEIASAYETIAPASRPVGVRYLPKLKRDDAAEVVRGSVEEIEAALLAELGRVREREIERGMCLVGPHRDELLLMLGEQPAKGFASHGETWSYALALRIAQFHLLREVAGSDPVLMLDDVFAELDTQRREKLVQVATESEQVLITAAADEDLPAALLGTDTAGAALTRFTVGVEERETGRVSVLLAGPGVGDAGIAAGPGESDD